MLIIPAIDLQNGEAVRLYKGDYNQKTVYSQDPPGLARGFEEMGVKYLHIVDLDGAKEGSTVNINTIQKMRETVNIPIQVGGGIRTAATVARYLEEIKIDRVILGTAAVQQPKFLKEMLGKYGPERIVVGVDMRDGKVAAAGWLENTGVHYLAFIEDLKQMGVQYIVGTDISKDGTLTSPNWAMYEPVQGINIIVAGGVSKNEDIYQARAYYGIIVGKAYYEGKVDLPTCLKNV
jgi:phosphoribosylformimino-5-aminoimidazole carboxamide ribotide isomerase